MIGWDLAREERFASGRYSRLTIEAFEPRRRESLDETSASEGNSCTAAEGNSGTAASRPESLAGSEKTRIMTARKKTKSSSGVKTGFLACVLCEGPPNITGLKMAPD